MKGNEYGIGNHWKASEETKLNMSNAQKGNKNALGKIYKRRLNTPLNIAA